ncbi:MAG: LysM peptidoglycan-binding domain-containing protein [Planctomycetes bacterium]|nr:LysM peptidoglycan-binding domain-containing protein [Planctomycetota bacterium]
MTRETKIGLLVGMGVIILIGILISDHLSDAQRQQPAQLAGNVPPEISRDMIPSPVRLSDSGPGASSPLPLPSQLGNPGEHAATTAGPRPDIIRQDGLDRDLIPAMKTMTDLPPNTAGIIGQQRAVESARDTVRPTPNPVPTTGSSNTGVSSTSAIPEGFVVVDGHRATLGVMSNGNTTAAPKQTIHYVKEGETLSAIARQYYGNPGDYQIILDANRKAIPNENLVRPGVRLIIPSKSAPAPGNVAPAPASTPPAASPKPTAPQATRTAEYTVQEDDTLSSLAAKFMGSSKNWQKLYELNKDRISNPDRIAEGTVIRVPAR